MNSEEKNGLASKTERIERLRLERSSFVQLQEKVEKTATKLNRCFNSFMFDLDYLIRMCTEELDELSRQSMEVDKENGKQ